MAGSATAEAAAPTVRAYTCTGGAVPSGSYASIRVTGNCSVATDAVINVVGNIDVAAGAGLDAQSAPSTITLGRNMTASAGSFVGLGCQPRSYTGNSAHECVEEPQGHSTITVNGNVTGTGAQAVPGRSRTTRSMAT